MLNTHSKRRIPLAASPLSAGPAIEITGEHQMLDINELITGGREGFVAYPVTGDSMLDRIPPGSIVFVDTWAEPRHGSIIAADVDGLVCVKVFECSDRGLYLVSSNAEYIPRKITRNESFHILGVVKSHLALHH